MKKCAVLLAGSLLFMLLCRFSPAFSGWWLRLFIRPFSIVLGSVTSRVPFPLLETLGVALTAYGIAALLQMPFRPKSLKKTAVGLLHPAALLLCAYALLWYPAYWSAPPLAQSISADRTEALCRALIHRLNESELRFSDLDSAMEKARNAVSDFSAVPLPEGAVKAVRYPEWMNLAGVSGLYSPWTAEALVHPGLAPGERIFTAAHELMHLLGVAGEGLANIAAWTACHRAGGEASASANLMALRYSMHALRSQSEERWRACVQQMSPGLEDAFYEAGGFSRKSIRQSALLDGLLTMIGLRQSASNYDALVPWLADAFSVPD